MIVAYEDGIKEIVNMMNEVEHGGDKGVNECRIGRVGDGVALGGLGEGPHYKRGRSGGGS